MQKNKEARATENSAKETALHKALNGLAKGVRVLTVPPLMAAALLLILRADKGYLSQGALYWALFFLTFLPLASYGVWAAIPPLRRRGRDAQRSLAVIFSVAGYLGVALYGVLAARPVEEQIVFFTYLISGALIALFSFVFHIKSSGHAGLSGEPLVFAGIFAADSRVAKLPAAEAPHGGRVASGRAVSRGGHGAADCGDVRGAVGKPLGGRFAPAKAGPQFRAALAAFALL